MVSCSFQLCCSLIYRVVPSSTKEDTVVANAMTEKVNEQDTKHFQNVMQAKSAKNYTYKCVDCSGHSGIKGALTKCVRLVCTFSLGTLDSLVS